MPPLISGDEYMSRIRAAHGDRYDYSKLEYRGMSRAVTIICREHGEFQQRAQVHMLGHGCRRCNVQPPTLPPGPRGPRKTTAWFISEAKSVHGDRYDYSQAVYHGAERGVDIICRVHGPFRQRANHHLRGSGCKRCACVREYKAQEQFVAESRTAHGARYDYSQTVYRGADRKLVIICPTHGKFWQMPHSHLRGSGCPNCKGLKSQEQFLADAHRTHGDHYDYSRAVYRHSMQKVEIICRRHGPFWQTPSTHWAGAGCPVCRDSRGERAVRHALQMYGVEFKAQWTDPEGTLRHINPLRVDFCLPEARVLIEFDGDYHRRPVMYGRKTGESATRDHAQTRLRDAAKDAWAKANGYRLIRLRNVETVLQDLIKKGILPLEPPTHKQSN